jgi:hypothetical protein
MSTDDDNRLPSWFWKLVIGGGSVPMLLICFTFLASWSNSSSVVPIVPQAKQQQTSATNLQSGRPTGLGRSAEGLAVKVIIGITFLGLVVLALIFITSTAPQSAKTDYPTQLACGTKTLATQQRLGVFGWVIITILMIVVFRLIAGDSISDPESDRRQIEQMQRERFRWEAEQQRTRDILETQEFIQKLRVQEEMRRQQGGSW